MLDLASTRITKRYYPWELNTHFGFTLLNLEDTLSFREDGGELVKIGENQSR